MNNETWEVKRRGKPYSTRNLAALSWQENTEMQGKNRIRTKSQARACLASCVTHNLTPGKSMRLCLKTEGSTEPPNCFCHLVVAPECSRDPGSTTESP